MSKAIVYVLACVLLWALIPVVSKLGQSNLDNHQFLFWSSLVSFTTFLILILTKKQAKDLVILPAKKWLQSIGLGLLGTYLYYILLYFAYANAKGIEVLIIQYCWPLFVLILSIFILKEKLNFRKIISIALSFLGVFLVLSKGDFSNIHFDNWAIVSVVLLAAFVFGLFSVLSKKVTIDALLLTSIYFLTATVASFISMLIFSDFKWISSDALWPVLINGIFVNGVSYIFWIKALKIGKASFIAPFVFLTPVISTVLLILFFKEPFELIYAFGMVAVIVGGLINKA
jgi:drug/metabolite transporter (DMT)-like permease